MKELLKSELLKLKKSKSFYGWGVFLTFTIFVIELNEFIGGSYTSSCGLLNFILILPIFPAICLLFSSKKALENIDIEYIKNVPTEGFTKKQIYFSKYIVSLLTILFYLIVSVIFAFLLGLVFFGFGSSDEFIEMLLKIAMQILATIALHSLSFGFATLFKNAGASIALNTIGVFIILLILDTIFGKIANIGEIMYYCPAGAFIGYIFIGGIDNLHLYIQLAVSVVYALIGIGVGLIRCRDKKD